MTSGVPGVASTENPVDPIRRCTLVMTRSDTPTLKIFERQELRALADGAELEVVLEVHCDRRTGRL